MTPNIFKIIIFQIIFQKLTHSVKKLLHLEEEDYQRIQKKNNIDWDFNQDFEFEVNISKGKQVYHQKFGNGKIIKLDGDKALIDFENFSSKKVYLKFLKIID